MKLFNNTKLPGDILEAVINAAAKGVRGAQGKLVRTAKVVVQVNPSRRGGGTEYDCTWVRWTKDGKRKRHRKTTTDKGAFVVRLMNKLLDDPKPYQSPLEIVRHFFDVCRHEWGHIADDQQRDWALAYTRGATGKEYNERPQEARANDYADEANILFPYESFQVESAAMVDALCEAHRIVETVEG